MAIEWYVVKLRQRKLITFNSIPIQEFSHSITLRCMQSAIDSEPSIDMRKNGPFYRNIPNTIIASLNVAIND